jgi:hypothetical protein
MLVRRAPENVPKPIPPCEDNLKSRSGKGPQDTQENANQMLFVLPCSVCRVITTAAGEGESNVGMQKTTMIYTHVLNRGPSGGRSLVDGL